MAALGYDSFGGTTWRDVANETTKLQTEKAPKSETRRLFIGNGEKYGKFMIIEYIYIIIYIYIYYIILYYIILYIYIYISYYIYNIIYLYAYIYDLRMKTMKQKHGSPPVFFHRKTSDTPR